MKKIIVLMMVFSLLIGTMAGCSSGKKDGKSDIALTKGRYVEETISLPSAVARSRFLSFSINADNDIELYVHNEQGREEHYEKYIYKDKEWNGEEIPAFDRFVNQSQNKDKLRINNVINGEDGKLYILCERRPSYHTELYCLTEAGRFEKIDITTFKETNDGGYTYRPTVVRVLENGMIAASYYEDVEVYSPDGESINAAFSADKAYIMTVDGNVLYYTSQNNKELLSMDMENNEPKAVRPLEMEISEKGIIRSNDKAVYLCDITGIHMSKEGGSIWETIVDGSQGGLSNPSLLLTDFVLGAEDDYYIILNGNDGFTINRIFYDENAEPLYKTEISIYSIYDSKTIRQAILLFQESHPDVKINYRSAYISRSAVYTYGLKDPEETITLNDHINALNTELLANKGADILVMDSLPVDSYIEKGILEDMSDIFDPMIEAGELLTNITDNYVKDGKIYTMPVRIKVPLIYGKSEAVNAAKSPGELARYIQGDNSRMPLLDRSNYRAFAAWFTLLYYNQLLNDKNELDEGLLIEFLENLNVIAENIDVSDDAGLWFSGDGKSTTAGYWVAGGTEVHRQVIQANISEVLKASDFSLPVEAAKQWGGDVQVINNTFGTNTIVGINSAGDQKELAREFVQFLFSTDIQSTEMEDGFPIRIEALKKLMSKSVDPIGWGGRNGYYFQANPPSPEFRDNMYNEICELSKPIVNDMTMINMILDEAEAYLRGDITADQAAQNTVSTINTYLSE